MRLKLCLSHNYLLGNGKHKILKVGYHLTINQMNMKLFTINKMTHVVESMVLLMLYKYREYLNRDIFILPKDKSIDFFTNTIDKAVNFFSKENEV